MPFKIRTLKVMSKSSSFTYKVLLMNSV